MMLVRILSTACAVALIAGCAASEQAREVETSGFLGSDYGLLREGQEDEALLVYRNPSANWAAYFDPRFRWAADIYNRALTEGLASADGNEFEPRGGVFELPFGQLEVAFDEADLLWEDRRLEAFVPVAELGIRGLRNRYRQAGLGRASCTFSSAVTGTFTRGPT